MDSSQFKRFIEYPWAKCGCEGTDQRRTGITESTHRQLECCYGYLRCGRVSAGTIFNITDGLL
jgi:hypothetical protein